MIVILVTVNQPILQSFILFQRDPDNIPFKQNSVHNLIFTTDFDCPIVFQINLN